MEKKVVASLMVLVVMISAFVATTSAENDDFQMLHTTEAKGGKGKFDQSDAYISNPVLEKGKGYIRKPPSPPANEYRRGCTQENRCRGGAVNN